MIWSTQKELKLTYAHISWDLKNQQGVGIVLVGIVLLASRNVFFDIKITLYLLKPCYGNFHNQMTRIKTFYSVFDIVEVTEDTGQELSSSPHLLQDHWYFDKCI